MNEVTVGWITDAIHGFLMQGDRKMLCAGLSTDSRSVRAREVFCALQGERFDGHDFVEIAINKGATAVIVKECVSLPSLNGGAAVIVVSDTLWALGSLARRYRQQFDIPVIAITGSNGKTTTKEMIASILSVEKKVVKNEGNLNNLIGLPLSLLNMMSQHEVGVFELGMNHTGEIGRLTEIADPTIGVITNVGPVHLEYLGSIEAVAEAKGELFSAMSGDATAIFNIDDQRVTKLAQQFPGETVSFGLSDSAEVRAQNIRVAGVEGMSFEMIVRDKAVPIELPMVGEHNVMNALAAAAAATAAGVSGETVAAGLRKCKNIALRHEIVRVDGQLMIINDCYNANPASMEAALATFSRLKKDVRGIVVLGDMLELGTLAAELHRELGGKAALAGADYVIAIGHHGPDIKAGAVANGMDDDAVVIGSDLEAVSASLLRLLEEPATILVKGSRKMALERIVKKIEQIRNTAQPYSNV